MISKDTIVSVTKCYAPDGIFYGTFKVVYETDKEVFVPNNEANTDYQEIQKWIADGGTVIDNPPEETP